MRRTSQVYENVEDQRKIQGDKEFEKFNGPTIWNSIVLYYRKDEELTPDLLKTLNETLPQEVMKEKFFLFKVTNIPQGGYMVVGKDIFDQHLKVKNKDKEMPALVFYGVKSLTNINVSTLKNAVENTKPGTN